MLCNSHLNEGAQIEVTCPNRYIKALFFQNIFCQEKIRSDKWACPLFLGNLPNWAGWVVACQEGFTAYYQNANDQLPSGKS